MANCNCNDFPISCAPHAPGGDCCHPHGCPPHPHPCPPPPFKGGTSMYIGARYVPIFADPVEWDDEREYEPLTIVVHNGDCYTSKCYVPKGAQLPPYPEGQTKYWVKTSDYNYQFADLKKTVTDLSRLVEQFQKDNERFTELINGWNEKVIQWEKDMAAWGERLDAVESNVADLTASLNAEIDRAKAAEQANAAAIAQETADRKQAVSELDAAYKAADAAEAQARAEADTALSNRITTNTTDIDAIKAEQVIQNTNISANAKNISDNAAEIAKHAARLTDLESNASDWDDVFPDTTIAQEVQKEENTRANAVTELKAKDAQLAADVEEVRDLANHKVDQTVFQAADNLNVKYSTNEKILVHAPALFESVLATREDVNRTKLWGSDIDNTGPGMFGQVSIAALALKSEVDTAQAAADKANTNIGDWETDHPNQTISQCVTSQETELEEHAGDIARLEADKADKSEIPDVSGFVTTQTYTQGQAAQNYKTQIPEGGVRIQTAGVYWNLDTYIKMTIPLWVIPSNWDIQWNQQPDLTVPRLPTSGLIELFNPKTGTFTNKAYESFRARFDAINGCLEFYLFCDASDLPQAVMVTGLKTIQDAITTYYPTVSMLWNS